MSPDPMPRVPAGGLRLGRIAGVRIGASWSVLAIAALLTWSLASTILPAQAPGLSQPAYWLGGLAASGLFLGSLLAHELGHALVARSVGLRVTGINLWLLGGVAQLDDEPASPRDDLRVALVGPAVSLVLAAGFGLAAVALGAAGVPTLASATAGWLAIGNGLLALFNLLPAAPLDGGRVLRALLWRRHGNRVRAAVTAAKAGQVAGFGLLAYGLLGSLTGRGLAPLWTALVGWFLVGAARQEQRHTVVHHGLAGLRVADIMAPAPLVPAWLTVDVLLRDHVAAAGQAAAPGAAPRPVTALALERIDGQPAGVVTVAALRSVPAARRQLVRGGDLAVPAWALPVTRPDEPVTELLERLSGGAGIAVVVAGGQLVGLVTRAELNRAVAAAAGAPAPPPPGTLADRGRRSA